jgi:catechol 2,3-dioxygenase-like lactoylglutathione lyase family enzyme
MSAKPTGMANAIPILRVEDVEVSLAYYTGPLGFKLDWRAGTFLSVSRDRFHVMLCQGEQGNPGTWLWIPAEDVDALYAEWTASGAMLRQKPTNFPWGSREIQVTDPDRHVLRFAAESKPGEPMGDFTL